MAAASGALKADSILSYIAKSIPAQEDKQAIKDPYAAIAIFTHACMLAVGFKLVGLGEDHKIEAHSEPSDTRPVPTEWDQQSGYAFRYSHPQSSMEFLVKLTRLGGKAIVFGVGMGDDKTAQVEIKAEDYISQNSLKDVQLGDTDSLRHAFISNGRIEDLSSLLKASIIQKLIPGLRKEGYEESANTAPREQASAATRQPRRGEEDRPPERDPLRDDQPQPARPHPFDDPLAAAPRRPRPTPDFAPPGFEDEHELQRPRGGLPGMPGQPFGNIGDRDLYPPGLGPHDPLRMGPGGGGIRGGGGMYPTFDDPLFQGQGGQGGYDPMAPPGARYDPVGPGDGPPNLRGGPRFPGGGGRGFGGGFGGAGGRPPNPFGGFGGGDFI